MKKNFLKVFTRIVPAAIFLMALAACQDDSAFSERNEEDIDLASLSSSADIMADEEIQEIDDALISDGPDGGRMSGNSCVVISRNESEKTVVLDFGTGCTGPHGRERSGKVIIVYTGQFNDGQANRVITFENFFVNGKQISGTIEVGNYGLNSLSQLTWTRKLVDYTVTFPNGKTVVSNGSTVVTWLEGRGDNDRTNNVFQVTGSTRVAGPSGRTAECTIIEPIIARFSCLASGGFLRVAGKKQMKSGNRTRTVDFGDGECDKTIVITINGNVRTITIS